MANVPQTTSHPIEVPSTLYRWDVYASDGRGKRKDRRIVHAATIIEALDVAAKARGWRAMVTSRATCIGERGPAQRRSYQV